MTVVFPDCQVSGRNPNNMAVWAGWGCQAAQMARLWAKGVVAR